MSVRTTTRFVPIGAMKTPKLGGIKGTNTKKVTVHLDENSDHFDVYLGDELIVPSDVKNNPIPLAEPLAESLYAAYKENILPYDQKDLKTYYNGEALYWNVLEEWRNVLRSNRTKEEKAFRGVYKGRRITPTEYPSNMLPTEDQKKAAKEAYDLNLLL